MIQTNCFKYMRVKYIFFFHFKEIVIYRPITVNTPYFKFVLKTLHVICTPGQSNLPLSITRECLKLSLSRVTFKHHRRECLKLSLSHEGDMIFNIIYQLYKKFATAKCKYSEESKYLCSYSKFETVKLRHKTRSYKDA